MWPSHVCTKSHRSSFPNCVSTSGILLQKTEKLGNLLGWNKDCTTFLSSLLSVDQFWMLKRKTHTWHCTIVLPAPTTTNSVNPREWTPGERPEDKEESLGLIFQSIGASLHDCQLPSDFERLLRVDAPILMSAAQSSSALNTLWRAQPWGFLHKQTHMWTLTGSSLSYRKQIWLQSTAFLITSNSARLQGRKKGKK